MMRWCWTDAWSLRGDGFVRSERKKKKPNDACSAIAICVCVSLRRERNKCWEEAEDSSEISADT